MKEGLIFCLADHISFDTMRLLPADKGAKLLSYINCLQFYKAPIDPWDPSTCGNWP